MKYLMLISLSIYEDGKYTPEVKPASIIVEANTASEAEEKMRAWYTKMSDPHNFIYQPWIEEVVELDKVKVIK